MSSPLGPFNPTGAPFGTPPTVAPTAAAGTTATAAVLAGSIDQRGQISVSSAGTGQAAGAQATVTFGKPLQVGPVPAVQLTPLTAATALLSEFVTSISNTGFQIGLGAAPSAGITYSWAYTVTP